MNDCREKGRRGLKSLRDTYKETTACRLFHGQVNQSMDLSYMEKRDNQGGEYSCCGIGEDAGRS